MKCPICKKDFLDSLDTSFVGEEMFEYMLCMECGAEWTNVWRYVGREDITEGE